MNAYDYIDTDTDALAELDLDAPNAETLADAGAFLAEMLEG